MVEDSVMGVLKNVVQLTAWSADDPENCPGPLCHKLVTSNGALATAGLFGSGRYARACCRARRDTVLHARRYEVIARVPASPGLVFAIWTFRYEEHLPANCAEYACWCNDMPSDVRPPRPPPPPPVPAPDHVCGGVRRLRSRTSAPWARRVEAARTRTCVTITQMAGRLPRGR